MSEENKEQIQEEVQEELIQEQAQQEEEQPVEQEKAKKNGHISKEEWEAQGRDPNKWKSPEDFNAFGDEYKHVKPHIDMLKEELQKSNRRFDIVAKHIEDIKKAEYERGKSEIEARLNVARQAGDMDTAIKLSAAQRDNEMRRQMEVQNQMRVEQERVDADFVQRNKHWYNDSHPALKDEAVAIGREIANLYPTISYEELVSRIERRMSYDHPDIVNRGSAPQKPIVSNSSGVNKVQLSEDKQGGREFKQMNLDERDYQELASWLKQHAKLEYSKADYIKDLKKRGQAQ